METSFGLCVLFAFKTANKVNDKMFFEPSFKEFFIHSSDCSKALKASKSYTCAVDLFLSDLCLSMRMVMEMRVAVAVTTAVARYDAMDHGALIHGNR